MHPKAATTIDNSKLLVYTVVIIVKEDGAPGAITGTQYEKPGYGPEAKLEERTR